MLALLVLFGCLHHAQAAVSDILQDINYVIKQNVSCPASIFFFQREMGPNSLEPDLCYLCFCQNNDSAVCWRRQNRRCDLDHYQVFGTRSSRVRRSPLSLDEVYLRDAARDFFNKQSPKQCKPFESSFSDGCPPADWCTGCTVCDCDANGHWDCHILSFCSDKNGKKQMKKRQGHSKNRNARRQSMTSRASISRSIINTTKPLKKPTRKRYVNSNISRHQVKQISAINKHKINQVKASKLNKLVSVKKPLPKLQAKKAFTNRNGVTSRPLYIKINVSTSKPVTIKSNFDKTANNNTVEVAQKAVKQFMLTVQTMIKNIDLKTNKTAKQVNKVLQKRSMSKQDSNRDTKEDRQKPKLVTKRILDVNRKSFGRRNTIKLNNSGTSEYARIKRQIAMEQNASHKNVSYSSGSNAINNIYENVESNRTLNLFVNNSITSISNIPRNFNNKTVNTTRTYLNMDTEIYAPDNHIVVDNQHSPVKNETIFNGVNNTVYQVLWTVHNNSLQQNTVQNNKVEDIIFLTTDRSYLQLNFTQLSNNNRTDLQQNLPEKSKNHENDTIKMEKKNPHVSIQTKHHTNDHSCKFRILLQKLIGTHTDQYNNTIKSIEASKKTKKYTILTKMKRLFKKIFNKKYNNKLDHKNDWYYSDYGIKEYDNKKFGNCKLNSKEKGKLGQKINELKSESENILQVIGTIKGLLHILQINTNETQYKIPSDLNTSNEYINKLNIIVKNTYYNGENGKELTKDQRTQIKYIRDNVLIFIKSIEKFITLLDDIIQIAICRCKIKNSKINKNNYFLDNTVKDYSNTTQAKVENLKKLILDYNILQNKFIHQIYVLLNSLERNVINKNNSKPIIHTDHYIEINKTDATEANPVNIFKNVRKFKLITERINAERRRKREALDNDDALEYLLILMEYLLKRHGPVYPSVNDGFDLLIEAIKSAPDIKLIRKKVLNNVTEKPLITSTTAISLLKKYTNYSTSHTLQQKKHSSEMNKNKIKIAEQLEGNEDNDEEKMEEIYRSFKSNRNLSSEESQENTLLGRSDIPITSELYYNIQEASTRTSHNNRMLGYKTEYSSLEEEITTTSNTMPVELDTTSTSPAKDYSNVINANLENQVKSISNNFLVDSRPNKDWIKENFKEIKQSREIETRSSTWKSLTATRTHKYTENISDVTNENETYNEKKVHKSSAEEIMTKKQLDLLNSLDYVEDEIESKDDKFLSNTYV